MPIQSPTVMPTGDLNGNVTISVGPAGATPTNVLVFPANPDQNLQSDARVTVTQTESGAYFDDYGTGIDTLTLTGSMAYQSSKGMYNGAYCNGAQAAQHLQWDILKYYFAQENSVSNPQNMTMVITDSTVGSSWQVKPYPPFYEESRTKDDPMVYQFICYFKVIRDLINGSNPTSTPDPVQALLATIIGTPGVKYGANGGLAPAAVAAAVQIAPNYNLPSNVTNAVNAANAESQTPPTTYTVQSGDTLSAIAVKFYSNGLYWTLIYDANQQYIKNPNLIFVGQNLTIPPTPGANQQGPAF